MDVEEMVGVGFAIVVALSSVISPIDAAAVSLDISISYLFVMKIICMHALTN